MYLKVRSDTVLSGVTGSFGLFKLSLLNVSNSIVFKGSQTDNVSNVTIARPEPKSSSSE